MVHGSCLCGAVQFRYQGPSLWSAHCHCTLCRRAHGAAFVTWVGTKANTFEVTQADELRWFESSPGARRGFCHTCGTTLFFESSRWPGEMHVTRANLQEEIDLEPQAHTYYADHAAWIESAEELERR